MDRLCQRPLPPYSFLPGGPHPHPEKPGGHYATTDIRVAPLDTGKPEDNEDFLHALDLFNHGHHWEAHVWFEALWNAHGRKGEVAEVLKGLIKICAAAVKERMGHLRAARGHGQRAQELLAPLPERFLGLDLQKVRAFLKKDDGKFARMRLEFARHEH